MSLLHLFQKDKFDFYLSENPKKFLILLFIASFILYTIIDFTNTYIFTFYPIYHSIYAKGVADSIYFSNAVNNLLALKLPASNFDGGLVALIIYIFPVEFSHITGLDIGLSFRLFYCLILFLAGYGIFLVAQQFYSDQTAIKLSLLYVFNPLIFLLSVWAGSEEIIEACLVIYVIYLTITKKYNYAIILALITSFYKYYSILLLPIIILSMEDERKKIKTTIILAVFFILAVVGMILFLDKYISNIYQKFIAQFHLHGKGVFNLLVEYGHVTQVNESLGFMYYGIIGIAILLFIWYTRNSAEPFKYGFVFIVFFVLFPEFYSSYLIIPFLSVALLYPKITSIIPKVNFFILPVLSFLSEFSFNLVDSPYALLHITPTIPLRIIGVTALFGLYALIISWLILYLRYVKNEKVKKLVS